MILALFSLITVILFFVYLNRLELLPTRLVLIIGIVLLVLEGVAVIGSLTKSKGFNITSMVISVIMIIVSLLGLFAANTAYNSLAKVTGATGTETSMVVAVRADDPASVLLETQGYTYGTQSAVDQEQQTEAMSQISQKLTNDLNVVSFDTLINEANGLLNGQVQAIVYNEGFTDLFDDAIENYSDRVKIIDRFTITQQTTTAQKKNDDSFLLYISGIDTAGSINTTSRSDVNILMAVNEKTHKITMVTTPRDYYVIIPGISGETRDKLTHAGIYGINASIATLNNLYGVDIDYYARVNFTTLVSLVDALGGIDVEVDTTFSSGGYTFTAGTMHMDGDMALVFSRERYSLSGGDNDRGINQERVLTAILNKAMSPAVLPAANQIISDLSDLFQTNMSQEELAKLISEQLDSGANWTIDTYAVTGTGDNQTTYSMPDYTAYVMQPDAASVQVAAQALQATLNGN